jgi:hypothetical protein
MVRDEQNQFLFNQLLWYRFIENYHFSIFLFSVPLREIGTAKKGKNHLTIAYRRTRCKRRAADAPVRF